MEIRKWTAADNQQIFEVMREAGEEWSCYHDDTEAGRYRMALESSLTYVALEENLLCGFVRCRDDDGFGIYVYDLLVKKSCRHRQTGRKLLAFVCKEHPEDTVYVMSDEDGYYEKLGYHREGSVFLVEEK